MSKIEQFVGLCWFWKSFDSDVPFLILCVFALFIVSRFSSRFGMVCMVLVRIVCVYACFRFPGKFFIEVVSLLVAWFPSSFAS